LTLSKDATGSRIETFTVAIHDAEEGGYWAEVLELPGCASQGETLDELKENIIDAIEACLDVYLADNQMPEVRPITTMSVHVAIPG
jgi:predicted RNase H-like HicB family nuclease